MSASAPPAPYAQWHGDRSFQLRRATLSAGRPRHSETSSPATPATGSILTGVARKATRSAATTSAPTPPAQRALPNGGTAVSILNGASGNSVGGSTLQANLTAAFNHPGIVADGSAFMYGFDGGGSASPSNLLGNSIAWNGNAYTFGATGGNNAIFAAGQTITLSSGFDSTLTFLAAGVNGSQANQTFTVTYTDNSTQTFTQSFSDWGNRDGLPRPIHRRHNGLSRYLARRHDRRLLSHFRLHLHAQQRQVSQEHHAAQQSRRRPARHRRKPRGQHCRESHLRQHRLRHRNLRSVQH